jgi:hypothetical protein
MGSGKAGTVFQRLTPRYLPCAYVGTYLGAFVCMLSTFVPSYHRTVPTEYSKNVGFGFDPLLSTCIGIVEVCP